MKNENQFIREEVNQLWEAFGRIAENEAFQVFDQQIKELSRFVNAYRSRYIKLIGEFESGTGNIVHLREFTKKITELLAKNQDYTDDVEFKVLSEGYVLALENQVAQLPESILRKELFSKYQIYSKDKPAKFVKKILINSAYTLSLNYKRVINYPRRLLKLPSFDLQAYRNRKVPFRGMVVDFLNIGFSQNLMQCANDLMKAKSNILLDLWKFDDTLGQDIQTVISKNKTEDLLQVCNPDNAEVLFSKLLDKLGELRKKLHLDINEFIKRAFVNLDNAMPLVDTPDLSPQQFHPQMLETKRNRVNANNTLELKKWENTHKTLFDDWALDVEIVALHFSVFENFIDLKGKINLFINTNLTLNFGYLRQFVNDSASHIETRATTTKLAFEILREERKKVNHELIDKMLTQTVENLAGNFIDDLEKFKLKTFSSVGKVSDRRVFTQAKSYERGIRDSEINHISPRELLNFEALPHFVQALGNIKLFVEESLEKIRVKLLAMGTVSDFSLESALMLLEQKKNAVKGSVKIAIEGYERAIGHLDEAMSFTEILKEQPLAQLKNSIDNFNLEIQKLKNSENILELNLRIAKITAIERSKKARRDAVDWIKNIIPVISGYLNQRFSDTSWLIDTVKSKIGLAPAKKQISYEISEFIRQTNQSLKDLPYVYQRLYQLRPTDEDRFFVDRKEELKILNQAFDDWNKERFVTVAVTGEKGSGVTSFLSYFLRKLESEIPVIHQTAEVKIYKPEAYFDYFAGIVGVEKFQSNDEIIAHLNNQSGWMIIVIENLHHFYLKKIHGFDCQKMLFDLMANTAQKVFWIGSYTIHSWDYLNKTLHIADHFVREVRLQQMSDLTLREIIFKRNHLSGYKLIFLPSPENTESRSFRNMDELAKQQFLIKQFFSDLRDLSNGNISLAQLYWLRSTQDLTDDTISIASIREVDVSFVKGLTNDYIFALHAILVHDGLTLTDYAAIFNLPETSCRQTLIPMLEKGLLIRPREKYNVNPIIFRQVVNLLHSRNFIY